MAFFFRRMPAQRGYVVFAGLRHVLAHAASMSLSSVEAQALDALRTKAPPDATTITWWDDGYPALYFARTRTLIDGGRREARR